ncbi:MAG: hypothetical protein ABW042_07975, partial [Phenylobacterium sp.]
MSKAAVIRRLSDEGLTAAEIVAKTGYVHQYVWRTLDKAKKLPWQRHEAAITDMTPPLDVAYYPPTGGADVASVAISGNGRYVSFFWRTPGSTPEFTLATLYRRDR